MSKLCYAIPITLACWLLATTMYAYYWVSSILAEPGLPVYERGGLLPLLGFAVYRLPYLLIGLVIMIVLELVAILVASHNPLYWSDGNHRKHS